MTKFVQLKEEILVDDTMKLVLEKGRNTFWRQGIRGLSDIWWYQYRIESERSLWWNYDRVLITPFFIDAKIQHDAEKEVLDGGVSDPKAKRPHVDFNTGNIHPVVSKKFQYYESEVGQLVLVRGTFNSKTGKNDKHCFPIVKEKPAEGLYYEYQCGERKRYVPRACYYPLIDEKDKNELTDCMGHILLERIWDTISNL